MDNDWIPMPVWTLINTYCDVCSGKVAYKWHSYLFLQTCSSWLFLVNSVENEKSFITGIPYWVLNTHTHTCLKAITKNIDIPNHNTNKTPVIMTYFFRALKGLILVCAFHMTVGITTIANIIATAKISWPVPCPSYP